MSSVTHATAEAARQFMLLNDPDATPEEIQGVLDWIEESPENKRNLIRVERFWHACGKLPEKDNVQTLPSRSIAGRLNKIRLHVFGSAAAVALVVLTMALVSVESWPLLSWLSASEDTVRYATAIGTSREITLSDGSTVTLGGASKLVVSYDKDSRDIMLIDGHAFFDVSKDASRPFVVDTGEGNVRAIGTRFDVRKVLGMTLVEVAQGAIRITTRDHQGQVRSMHVAAGIHASYSSDGVFGPTFKISPLSVGAWRYGKFHFVDAPLNQVVAELNRFSDHPIILDDPRVGDTRVTGAIRLENVEEWLEGFASISGEPPRHPGPP